MKPRGKKYEPVLKDTGLTLLLLAAAILLCTWLFQLDPDNSSFFAMSVFMLAVTLTSFFTQGYGYGIFQSVVSVICVNWLFSEPFGVFTLDLAGYPLTFATMLVVSLLISTLTSKVKRQEQQRFELERENLLANLLRSVSHDIRTPLTSILGASSVILESPGISPETQREWVGEIHKDAQWLMRMTENLLAVTRCANAGVAIKTEAEVVEEVISGAVVKFRRKTPDMRVEVRRPQEIILARMDAVLIEQVLVNLFENSALHSKTATRIRVEIFQEGKRVHIRVTDNGQGFSPDQLPGVFDSYAGRNREATLRRTTGIGLSVCQAIIHAHSGEITACNSADGGAQIDFWLPGEEDPHAE